MGKKIATAVLEGVVPDVRLVGCVENASRPQIGQEYELCKDVKVVSSIEEVGVADAVVIDFSSVQSTRDNLKKANDLKFPMIIGTTGLEQGDYELAKEVSKAVPVLVSSNMSLGVNLLFWITKLVTERLGDTFDIEIIEAHHRRKKDSPSGTARTLGEVVAEALGQRYDDVVVHGRKGMADRIRPPKEIGMHAVRGGGIIGDHTVLFASEEERVELRHMAHDRSVFAAGAVVAAKWIASKSPGFYSMRDILGL